MIRPASPDDTEALVEIARGTGVFKPSELVALREVLDDYHAENAAAGHRAACDERDGRIVSFVYFAPAAMTDRTWYVYWIAVEKSQQARGLGARLMRHVEDEVRARDGRLLLIETTSLPHYEPTRRFYLSNGYELAAVLADYYADGDDMVVFRKRFARGDRPKSQRLSCESACPHTTGPGG